MSSVLFYSALSDIGVFYKHTLRLFPICEYALLSIVLLVYFTRVIQARTYFRSFISVCMMAVTASWAALLHYEVYPTITMFIRNVDRMNGGNSNTDAISPRFVYELYEQIHFAHLCTLVLFIILAVSTFEHGILGPRRFEIVLLVLTFAFNVCDASFDVFALLLLQDARQCSDEYALCMAHLE
jgi:hypothetical protein